MSEQVYFHIDVNSAFLSWEAAYRLHVLGEKQDLREIPSVVGGDRMERHGIVLAKSIPAKKYKIHTGEALGAALQKCPQLVIIPPDYELYVKASKALMELLGRFSPKVEQYSIDEAFIDMTGCDKLYGTPVTAANNIKNLIYEELKFTVNIGISTNKLLAKMAGDLKKPNLVHTLYPEEIPLKMWPLPVEDLFFVGPATKRKLKNLGISTIGELAAADPDILQAHMKKQGKVIYNFANGIDDSVYLGQPLENKGYGNSVTTPYDVITMEHAEMVLLSLCETVGMRLRKDKVKGRCLSVSVRTCEFLQESHQKRLFSATNTTTEIYNEACSLLGQIWSENVPLRQIGVHISMLEKNAVLQYNLFDGDRYERMEILDQAVDQIREKYGENSVMRACFLTGQMSPMSGGISKEKRGGMTKPIV